MKTFKYLLFFIACTSSIQSYKEETTNFDCVEKAWTGHKQFIGTHKEIFEKHCGIWGVEFIELLNIIVYSNWSNLLPMPLIEEYLEEKPNSLRPYTQTERKVLLAYQSGCEECAMLEVEQLNTSYEIALKQDKFAKSPFATAFSTIWKRIASEQVNITTASINVCLVVVNEHKKDDAIKKIWNPKDSLNEIKLFCSIAEDTEDHLFMNLRSATD